MPSPALLHRGNPATPARTAIYTYCPTGVDHNAFFSAAAPKALFKDYMRAIITRTNTITGRALRDDPTIMWVSAGGAVEERCEYHKESMSWVSQDIGWFLAGRRRAQMLPQPRPDWFLSFTLGFHVCSHPVHSPGRAWDLINEPVCRACPPGAAATRLLVPACHPPILPALWSALGGCARLCCMRAGLLFTPVEPIQTHPPT